MTKIAVPIRDNLLSDVFGDCSSYVIYHINNKSNVGNKQEVPPLQSVSELLEWINKSGITDIIVHQMDKSLIKYFSGTKINLFIGVPIDNPENLIEEYLKGELHSDVSKVFQTSAN
jgi:predicted Fe-Mo cluster-binding NifX family protein